MILRKGRLYNNEKGRRAFQPIMKKNLLSNIPSYKHIQLNSGCFPPSFYGSIIPCKYDGTVLTL